MANFDDLQIAINRCADEIYVSTVRMMELEQGRDPNGLPELWKLLNEMDRFESHRALCIQLLEQYFDMEKEQNYPINFTYRSLYKELTKDI